MTSTSPENPAGGSPWDPAQYERFRDERSRPFFDLIALVRPANEMRIVDLGCGAGALTRAMHIQLRARETVGIDSSETMLARARSETALGLRFELGDIADFPGAGSAAGTGYGSDWDLVVSNAAVHWLPDHPKLFARLTGALKPGGQLAIQLPANHDHLSHTVADEVARQSPFREALGGWTREWTGLVPERYATLFHELGYREQKVRSEVYPHHLGSREDVVEWVKGTLLTDYARRLPTDLYARFLESYRDRLLPLLADARPYFYPFKRILLWGQR